MEGENAWNVDCMLCQDDYVCDRVIHRLGERKVSIPKDMRIASCHYSRLLDNYPVTITSLKFDIMEIGRRAAQVLLDQLAGKETNNLSILDYEISLKESTK